MKWIKAPCSHSSHSGTLIECNLDFEDTSAAFMLSAVSAGSNQLTLDKTSIDNIVFQISELTD